jgi:hypothetical protein
MTIAPNAMTKARNGVVEFLAIPRSYPGCRETEMAAGGERQWGHLNYLPKNTVDRVLLFFGKLFILVERFNPDQQADAIHQAGRREETAPRIADH